jgi:Holliday junction resolvase RusA-like endonuclease
MTMHQLDIFKEPEPVIDEDHPLTFIFPIEPKAIQSVRHRIVTPKSGKKPFVIDYQPKEVKEFKGRIRELAFNQVALLSDFEPFKVGVGISIVYVHKFLKKHTQAQINKAINGELVWKTTLPDMTDNLQKGWIDALKGILWKDDGLICHMKDVKKIYGPENEIRLKVWRVE